MSRLEQAGDNNTQSPGWARCAACATVLAPGRDLVAHASLPYASSLCGSCDDVCPVKIPLHDQLLARRREVVVAGTQPASERLAMRIAAWFLGSRALYELAGRVA